MPISRAQMPKQLTGGKRKKKLKRQAAIAINMKKRGVKPKGKWKYLNFLSMLKWDRLKSI